MTATDHKCIRVAIVGRVQGVGYRYWLVQIAKKFDVTGWVRNRNNGEVDAVVCGRSQNVDLLLSACQNGPTFANVSSVTVVGKISERFDIFEVRPTA